MTRSALITAAAAYALAACTTVTSVDSSGDAYNKPAVKMTPDQSVSGETLGVAGALVVFGHPVNALGLPGEVFSNANSALLYIIYDPLAPNWTIKERAFPNETFHLSLRAKNFRTGGDGEAYQILKRRALQLQREKGYTGYKLLDYSEGIESSTPFPYRVSEGTIQLVRGGER